MRPKLHRPDCDDGLTWVKAGLRGHWLIQVHRKNTRTFFRPDGKGKVAFSDHYGQNHEQSALAEIDAIVKAEWEALP
jgi:hypothetical protein